VPEGRVVAALGLDRVGRSSDGTLLGIASPPLEPAVARVRQTPAGDRLRGASPDTLVGLPGGGPSSIFFLHPESVILLSGGDFPERYSPRDDPDSIDPGLLADAARITVELIHQLAEMDLPQRSP
jgi:hypothetical protein